MPTMPPASWIARLAITSLAFMFDCVPEPVWNTTSGNSVVAACRRSPSCAARSISAALSRCELAERGVGARQRISSAGRTRGSPAGPTGSGRHRSENCRSSAASARPTGAARERAPRRARPSRCGIESLMPAHATPRPPSGHAIRACALIAYRRQSASGGRGGAGCVEVCGARGDARLARRTLARRAVHRGGRRHQLAQLARSSRAGGRRACALALPARRCSARSACAAGRRRK